MPGYDEEAAVGVLRDNRAGSPHRTITVREQARRSGRFRPTYVDERKLMVEDLQERRSASKIYRQGGASERSIRWSTLQGCVRKGYTAEIFRKMVRKLKPNEVLR